MCGTHWNEIHTINPNWLYPRPTPHYHHRLQPLTFHFIIGICYLVTKQETKTYTPKRRYQSIPLPQLRQNTVVFGCFQNPQKPKGFHRSVTPVWLSNCRQTRKCKYSNHDDYLFNLGIFLFGFQRQCFEVGLQKFDKFLHRILHLLAILSTFCLQFFSFDVFFSRKFFESLLLCGYLPYKFHVNLVFCLFFRTFLCVKPPLFM